MNEPMKINMKIHIRWMVRVDLNEVLKIENTSCGPIRWDEGMFLRTLRDKNTIGMVAECEEMVVGYMVFVLKKGLIEILNFVVHGEHRRMNVGTQMIDKLKRKLSVNRRTEILFVVNESNLELLLFLREMGFKAVGIFKDHFEAEELSEDGYLMKYGLKEGGLKEGEL